MARILPMMTARMKQQTLPGNCSWGSKINIQGKYEIWKVYKLHDLVEERRLPVFCFLAAASHHDNQATPFLLKKMARKVQVLLGRRRL